MSYSRISTNISNYLVRELKYSEEKKDIIAYSLDTLFLLIIGYILILTIGWIIGIPGAVLCMLLSGDILRKFSGGFHLSNPYSCLTVTTLMYTLVSWLSVQLFIIWGKQPTFNAILIILCIICIFLVSKYAPVDSPAKPIVSSSFRNKLKIISIAISIVLSVLAIIFINTFIGISITGGLIIQSLTLLPFLNKRINR